GKAFDDERIEAVECAENAEQQTPTLGRSGVGIGKMRKAIRQRRRAVHGDGVASLRRVLRGRSSHNRKTRRGDDDGMQPVQAEHRRGHTGSSIRSYVYV